MHSSKQFLLLWAHPSFYILTQLYEVDYKFVFEWSVPPYREKSICPNLHAFGKRHPNPSTKWLPMDEITQVTTFFISTAFVCRVKAVSKSPLATHMLPITFIIRATLIAFVSSPESCFCCSCVLILSALLKFSMDWSYLPI